MRRMVGDPRWRGVGTYVLPSGSAVVLSVATFALAAPSDAGRVFVSLDGQPTMSRQHEVEQRGKRNASDDARERLLAGTTFTERRLDLAGVSTAVLEGGEGPRVALLHGQGASQPSEYRSSGTW